MFDLSSDDFQQLCTDVLQAFSLVLAVQNLQSRSFENSILKRDDFSLVVMVCCMETDSSKTALLEPAKRFILKCVPEEHFYGSENTAKIEQIISAYSTMQMLPTRRATADGQYIFRKPAAQNIRLVWTVSEYIPNSPSFDWLDAGAAWSKVQTHSAGHLLGQLHQQSRACHAKFAENCNQILPSIVRSIPDLVGAAFADVASESLDCAIFSPETRGEFLRQINAAVSKIGSDVHGAQLIDEMIVIHGDYHPGNVLFAGNDALSVIDWDYAHLDHPILDVAYGIVMFAGKLACSGDELLDEELANSFLTGYRSAYSASDSVPVGIPTLFARQKLSATSYSAPIECSKDSTSEHDLLASHIKLAAALILLWTVSEQGRSHIHKATVTRKAIELVLSA